MVEIKNEPLNESPKNKPLNESPKNEPLNQEDKPKDFHKPQKKRLKLDALKSANTWKVISAVLAVVLVIVLINGNSLTSITGKSVACTDNSECITADKLGICTEGYCEYSEPIEFTYTILNDKECASCNTEQLETATSQMFPGAKPITIDISSEEGKELLEQHNIPYLPAVIFPEELEETFLWKNEPQVQQWFEKLDDNTYKLKDETTGSTHFATKEAEQEHIQKLGITIDDNRPQIDFFLMSYCPFGNIAEEAIAPVYELLKDYADFNPRYVYYPNYQGGGEQFCIDDNNQYCSMHGVQEANQNIRELCVQEEYDTGKWFEFAMAMNTECTYQNADECWVKVAEELNIDTDKIQTCEENKAEEFAKIDLELSSKFGAKGSPAVYVDGIEVKSGRTPEAYKQALCSAFDTAPEVCNTVLSDDSAGPEGSC